MINFHFTDTFGLDFKWALSVTSLVILLSRTVIITHRKSIVVNRISMIPYYAAIGEAIFMIVLYGCFYLFNIEEARRYSIYRDLLTSPTEFFYCTIVFVLSIYYDLLRQFLVYQRETNSM